MNRKTAGGRGRHARSAAALFIALAIFGACGRTESTPPSEIAAFEAERITENGLATLRTRVSVRFDRGFRAGESSLPLASHFEFEVPAAAGGTRRVLVALAKRSEMDRRVVELEVDALLPRGTRLIVQRRLFDPTARGTLEATLADGPEPAIVLLATQALTVSDAAFYDAAEPPPAVAEDDDPDALRRQLEQHLGLRGATPEDAADALQIFDAIPPETVPAAKLRAALAALTGTFAEPALASLFTPENCTGLPVANIDFRVPPGADQLLARVTYAGNGARVISIHPSLDGERFELLIPLLAHEAIHCDRQDGRLEEVAATAFDTLLYLHLLLADPSLAEAGGRLARELRVDALALINSGGVLPESIGLLRSPGVEAVLPETTAPYRSFAEFVAASYPGVTQVQSPPERLALEYGAVLAAAAGMPPGDPFDPVYLDELLGRSLDAGALFEVIAILGLEPFE